MKVIEYTLIRDVTMEECPWLDEDLEAGTRVYEYLGQTYGCISPDGLAVSMMPNITPFYEIPKDAIERDR